MVIDKIIRGVMASPLDERVKIEISQIVLQNAKQIDALAEETAYMAPERVDKARVITSRVMEMITPKLLACNVPHPNGRDTDGYIYKALGGTYKFEYEVKDYKSK